VSYWTEPTHHESAIAQSWLAHPLVRAHVNRKVSGSVEVWPTQHLRAQLADRIPLQRVLSIGCGMGALERDLVGQGIAAHVTGIDFSGDVLRLAREAAGGDARITYEAADAFEYLRANQGWDAILFHHSLHHFERIHELMRLVKAALAPGGVLWLDEFVGPSMSQWTWWKLVVPNVVYYLLPRSVRRPKLIRTPLNPSDPSEAVCAADILPAVESTFEIVERRDYGGNLVALLYPNLRRDAPDFERALRFLIRAEEWWLRRAKSFHTVILAR
jgi:SAM-dependent methyltransferase